MDQLPRFLVVLVVGHRTVKSLLEDRVQLAMFNVTGNANANFAHEYQHQQHGKGQHHAGTFLDGTAASDERNHKYDSADNN